MKQSNFSNILSNYGSKIWGLISVFIFIPLYIKYLGVESYGVIGFSSLLIGILSFADGGLSSAIIKEFSTSNTFSYKYSLLKSTEKVYIVICLLVIIVIFLFAPVIATEWLKSETIPIEKLTYFVRLIGISISIQLISSFYFGALFGLRYQVRANFIQIVWSVVRSLGVILALIHISATLEVFFIWQISANLIYVLLLRGMVMFHLKHDSKEVVKIEFTKIPQPVLTYISGMVLIALMSSINSQADKIVTSSFFSLAIYGYYTLASTLSNLAMIVANPFAVSIFPLFSELSSSKNEKSLEICYKKSSFLINLLILSVGVVLTFYTREILLLWTQDKIDLQYLDDIVIITMFLNIGTCFLAFQLIPYFYLLSLGKTKYNIYQGIVQLTIGIPMLMLFVKCWGLKGAGISWLLINLGGFIYLNFITFKYFLNLNYRKFILSTFSMPMVIIFLVSFPLYFIYLYTQISFLIPLFLTIILGLLFSIFFVNYKSKYSLFNFSHLIDFIKE
jgi:O-antigen/teichoic acid export membrane protein